MFHTFCVMLEKIVLLKDSVTLFFFIIHSDRSRGGARGGGGGDRAGPHLIFSEIAHVF